MFSDIDSKGIIHYASSREEEENEKKAAKVVEDARNKQLKGRYAIIPDETQRFLDYPEGRGFEPGYERNLPNNMRE